MTREQLDLSEENTRGSLQSSIGGLFPSPFGEIEVVGTGIAAIVVGVVGVAGIAGVVGVG